MLGQGYSRRQLGMVAILLKKETWQCRSPLVHLFPDVSIAKGDLQRERGGCVTQVQL